jgi:PKD repeat protein
MSRIGRCLALLLPALVVAADASAARYVATPAGGGRIVLNVNDGRLLRASVTVPARCENTHGGNWDTRLAVDLRGDLALEAGRFRIQGRAPSRVRYDVSGRLRDSAIFGRAWLTFLDLDFVGADDSFLCDSGARRYRAVRSGDRCSRCSPCWRHRQLTGCEKLCSQGAVTWCPRSEGDALNDAPRGVEIRARLDVGVDRAADRLTAVFRGEGVDPDEDPLRFEWDLDGDGDFERSGRVVSESFHRTARLRVTLRVTDFPRQLGAPGDVRATRVVAVADLDVNRPPTAVVDVRVRNVPVGDNGRVLVGQDVSFSPALLRDLDPGDESRLAFRWQFGEDNQTSRSPRADYEYKRVGVKTVRLKVIDPFGAPSAATRQLEVLPAPVPPTARLSVSPESPLVGEPVTLDASASTPGDLAIDDSVFFPGEGTGFEFIRGPVATVRYSRSGQQTIVLRVSDVLGFAGETSEAIRVRPNPEVNSPPDASFTVMPSSPLVGQEVRLDASASTDHEGPIARYEWDLDGDFRLEVDQGMSRSSSPASRCPRRRRSSACR